MRKALASVVLSVALVVGMCPLPAMAEAPSDAGAPLVAGSVASSSSLDGSDDIPPWVDATQYTYEIQPLIAPFETLFYVKTDNPNPATFRFVDKGDDGTSTWVYFSLYYRHFADVAYEDPNTFRVKGGYLFASTGGSDGGDLEVQARSEELYRDVANMQGYWDGNPYSFDIEAGTVPCVELKDGRTFLIDEYTDPSKPFFDNMDAV